MGKFQLYDKFDTTFQFHSRRSFLEDQTVCAAYVCDGSGRLHRFGN